MTTIVLVAVVLSKPVPGAAATGYKLFSQAFIEDGNSCSEAIRSIHERPESSDATTLI